MIAAVKEDAQIERTNRKNRKLRLKAVVSQPQIPMETYRTIPGQADFFQRYLPSIINGDLPPRNSRHNEYVIHLLNYPEFSRRVHNIGVRDMHVSLREKYEDFRVQMDMVEEAVGVKMRFVYNQVFDSRLYNNKLTENGWCLGISGMWLKRKKTNDDLFPNAIYQERSLNQKHGAVITLMRNQRRIIENFGVIKDSPLNKVNVNVMRYIGDGDLDPTGTVVSCDPRTVDCQRLVKAVLQDAATPRRKSKDGNALYLISMFFEGKGGHAMALDMSRAEFFDPNKGVFYHDYDDTQIPWFVFCYYIPLFYGKTNHLLVFRCI